MFQEDVDELRKLQKAEEERRKRAQETLDFGLAQKIQQDRKCLTCGAKDHWTHEHIEARVKSLDAPAKSPFGCPCEFRGTPPQLVSRDPKCEVHGDFALISRQAQCCPVCRLLLDPAEMASHRCLTEQLAEALPEKVFGSAEANAVPPIKDPRLLCECRLVDFARAWEIDPGCRLHRDVKEVRRRPEIPDEATRQMAWNNLVQFQTSPALRDRLLVTLIELLDNAQHSPMPWGSEAGKMLADWVPKWMLDWARKETGRK